MSKTEIGFEIRINGSIDYPVRVKYTTKLINDSVNTYSNTAVLNGDRSVSASVSHDDYDAFASKSYIYTSNQAKIDWTVEVNESLSSINNGTLVDTLSVGHEFDPSSIVVLKQPGDQAVDAGEYSVTVTDSDSGCSATSTISVIGYCEPESPTLIIDAIDDTISDINGINGATNVINVLDNEFWRVGIRYDYFY